MESCARRRVTGALIALAGVPVFAGAIAIAAAQSGVFALLGGTPEIQSKLLVSDPSSLQVTLQVRQFTLAGKAILKYDVDMQHTMHMIIVRDDFATFDHVHPSFDAATGTFSQGFTKEPDHRYYVYADTTPHGIGQQVFRFTLQSAGPIAPAPLTIGACCARTATATPYAVTLSKTILPASRAKNVNITILENGRPAQDLTPYLGAAAHAVFVNTSSLAYVHLHPMLRGPSMNMDAGKMQSPTTGPFMEMAVPALPPGTYKLWLQFVGNGRLYTVPFTLLAR